MTSRFTVRGTSGNVSLAVPQNNSGQGRRLSIGSAASARPRANSQVNRRSSSQVPTSSVGSTRVPSLVVLNPSSASATRNVTTAVRPVSPLSDSGSITAPISSSLRRPRDADNDDLLYLCPQRKKRLLENSAALAKKHGISDEELRKFINLDSLFSMFVDIKANLLAISNVSKENEVTAARELINSKDFQATLKARLTACLLSPNLTAYVVDTQAHVTDFMKLHPDMFKIPKIVFDDAESSSALGKTVSRILSNIRGTVKTALTKSLVRQSSIMDVLQSLARGSGLEIDSSHWHRFAFLRCCLRVFLIDQRDYKDVPLDKLFSPVLAGLLQPDTLAHVARELDIIVADLQQEVHGETDNPNIGDDRDSVSGDLEDADHQDNDGELDPPPSGVGGAADPSDSTNYDDGFSFFDLDNGASGVTSQEDPAGANNEAEVHVWTSGQFWNFVDHTLESLRKECQENSSDNTDYKAAYAAALVGYFQKDLHDMPGRKKLLKLIPDDPNDVLVAPDASSLPWQNTIQTQLLWC